MSFSLLHVCRACGAQTSVEQMVYDIIDDQEARRLLHDVLKMSLPLGAHVLRYLNLHKPPKQGLRWAKLRPLLVELLTDMKAGHITRKGRVWIVDVDGWRAALEAVFDAREKGTLRLPLQGNAYLYEIALRLVDKAEAQQELGQEKALRSRAHTSDACADIASLATAALAHKDPALAKLDADRAKAAPMPEEVRKQIRKLKEGN